jgi:hypothetical protein
MFLSQVFIGNTNTISRRTVRIAPETKKGTYYFLQDFFWSDMCHTHISSQRIAWSRMKRPAHRAEPRTERMSAYTLIHGIHGYMVLLMIQRYTNVQNIRACLNRPLLEINMA